MSTTATRKESSFVLTPAGTHIARCYAVIDLGTQEVIWNNQKKQQHKVHIRWELPGELMDNGEPMSCGKTYTLSTDPKAALRHDLESWAGRQMTPQEEEAFQVSKLIGKACQITVIHEKSKDGTKTYANVKAVTPLAKGSQAPAAVNPSVHYEIEMGTNEVYNGLSEYLRKKIAMCAEWSKDQGSDQGGEAPGAADEPTDDNIPF